MTDSTREQMITDLKSEGRVREIAVSGRSLIRQGAPPLVQLAEKLKELGVTSLEQLSDDKLKALHFEWIRGEQIG
jgi:hypothetical protein